MVITSVITQTIALLFKVIVLFVATIAIILYILASDLS